MPKKDRAYSVRIPPQVWEGQKDRILALYKEHILCKVLEKITTTEFSPSESQLREKLKEWGSKKRLSGKERKKINREIESKMVPIEQCEVVVHGEVQPAEKTCREYARTCNRGYRGMI
ncbi:uncharacterized protein J4E92_004554 [Alternaria infectoria]|uniref:uncharacterized protein n=1 Tax=Alternaria infectoria TaxID=45303 RepID=UPI002220CE79|nr:uncharacterized protein J4E92_004554 [Alternaria infectoria]KAI4930722.1 hypothetical protein J4E92_004554 [Alternaria infectoria]